MVNYENVVNGLVKYIDTEIVTQLSGFKKIAFATGVSLAMKKSENIFNLVKDNKIMHALDLVDQNYNIDIDTLKTEILKNMGEEKIPVEIPMIGKLTLNKDDIIKIYDLIKAESGV